MTLAKSVTDSKASGNFFCMPTTGSKLRVSVSHATVLAILSCCALLFALVVSIAFDSYGRFSLNIVVLALFFINGLLGIVSLAMAASKAPFSLVQVHWLFYVTFFVIAPFSQYLYGYSCWGYALSMDSYTCTNLLVLLWGSAFALASSRTDHASWHNIWNGFHDRLYGSLPRVSRAAVAVSLAISVTCLVFVIACVGFENLFSRSSYSTGLDKTLSLLFDKVIRSAPVFCFVIVLVYYKQSARGFALLILAFGLALVADFPFGMPRYNAAAVYGGLLLLTWRPLMERRGLFTLLFLIAFLLLFPAINVFRTEDLSLGLFISALGDALAGLPHGFCAGDYDAYSMLARAVDYVAVNGCTLGTQLLTALLFFVPRAWWAGKSVGSGQFIAEAQGQKYTNLSCPMPGEGYMNFGIVGLLAFAVVFGVLCRKLDSQFAFGAGESRIFYPFVCMMFFFIMRGDLLSSWAYTVGFAATFAVLWCLVMYLSPQKKGLDRD